MAKGAAIAFKSYQETVPKILDLIGLGKELKKHSSIVLKVSLFEDEALPSTRAAFVEQVLRFCLQNKNPVANIFIAEGAEGVDTEELFKRSGLSKLAERYEVGMIDLNSAETEKVQEDRFKKFEDINYPKILKESFIISLPRLDVHPEYGMHGALSNMLGAFPAKHYKGFFSTQKSKLRKYPLKYAIHDINLCKKVDFTVIDASDKGKIIAGKPLDMDLHSSKVIQLEENDVPYLRLIKDSLIEESPGEN